MIMEHSEEEYMDEEEAEPEKDTVSEKDVLSQVGPFQVPQHHDIIPLSILGCDQQNMEKNLSDFKWPGHRSAHVFANGWSTASHKRKMTLLEAPTGTLLLYYKDIKQETVHTLMLNEYGPEARSVEEVGNHHGQEAGQKGGFESSRNKWIFGLGSLLC